MMKALLMLLIATAVLHSDANQGPHVRSESQPYHPKPEYHEYAQVSRWLVHENQWATLSTISRHLDGAPYGHTVSYSDGPLGHSTGRLLFYLTIMDAAAQDLQDDSRATLSISEAQIAGACKHTDPEDPTCAKLSISGEMRKVPSEQLEEAQELLFSRHPAMKDWPAGHNFEIYELHILTMSLLDWYGGAHIISPEEYFAADVSEVPKQLQQA